MLISTSCTVKRGILEMIRVSAELRARGVSPEPELDYMQQLYYYSVPIYQAYLRNMFSVQDSDSGKTHASSCLTLLQAPTQGWRCMFVCFSVECF